MENMAEEEDEPKITEETEEEVDDDMDDSDFEEATEAGLSLGKLKSRKFFESI